MTKKFYYEFYVGSPSGYSLFFSTNVNLGGKVTACPMTSQSDNEKIYGFLDEHKEELGIEYDLRDSYGGNGYAIPNDDFPDEDYKYVQGIVN